MRANGLVRGALSVCLLLSVCTIYSTAVITPEDGTVLVLGSAGLVGSATTKWLRANGYRVAEVKNRQHMDLRLPDALAVFNPDEISFVFFFACEVGGSKFLEKSTDSVQLQIVEHNMQIYNTVFTWLKRKRTPFLFTSSYLQHLMTAYGTVKRLGEKWIEGLGFGRITRLWNVYGAEEIGLKSHVLPDWVTSALQHRSIQCRTDGSEHRQFLHVDDCAEAMGAMMQSYDKLELVQDLSSNQWIQLSDVAKLVAKLAPETTDVKFSSKLATARAKLQPNMDTYLHKIWKPTITLENGIQRLFQHYSTSAQHEEL